MRALLSCLSLLLVAVSHGQTGRLFPTVDAMVASADALYAGSIETIKVEPAEGSQRERKCHVEFRIKSTVKGPKRDTLTFDFVSSLPEKFLAGMAARHEKFLILTGLEKNELTRDLARKMGASTQEPETLWFRLYEKDVERYQDFDHNVFTADLRVIGTFDDLLKEAKALAKRYPKGHPALAYYTPSNSVARMCGDPNAYAAVCVPVSPATEALARRLLREPRKVVDDAIRKSRRVELVPTLTTADILAIRRAAVRLLSDFPTEQNRALIRPLLKDDGLQQEATWALQRMGG